MSLPLRTQDHPYPFEVEEGKTYGWCTCGLSEKQPLCDGAHKGSGMKSYRWTADKSGPVYFCGCKATKTPPFCDGSHEALPPEEFPGK